MFSSNTTQVSGGYEIQRSLRFNEPDSTNVQRTFSTTGTSQTTSTLSMWFKRGDISRNQRIFDCYDGSSGSSTGVFLDNDVITLDYGRGSGAKLITTQVLRDVSAWYHLVAVMDSSNATSSNRLKLYLNGSQITAFSTATYPSQNALNNWMSANSNNRIGSSWDGSARFSGYITEVNFIDGQALTPSSFGEINADTGVWQPKRYAGSYGTNGFYLNFSNNSNTTAATLGADYSGNGNNWTPNNFSVSAGAGNDSLVDVPTNFGVDTGVGGTVRGNYCTLNPLVARWDVNTAAITNGNLDAADTVGDANNPYVFGTLSVNSGKFYWEITVTAIGTSAASFSIGVDSGRTQSTTFTDWVSYAGDGNRYAGSTTPSAYGATYTTGDVIGVALDKDANTVTFYKNNASQGAISLPTNVPMVAWLTPGANSGSATANFGQRPFAYTAPSGFKALNTQNLPTPTIGATPATQAGKFFDVLTYTGNGSATQAITGLNFQPDFSWVKNRSNIAWYAVVDAVRTTAVQLDTTTTTDESNSINIKATYGGLSSFNSNGITVSSGSDNTYKVTNGSGQTYVAWNWKANGAGVTNTAGSITSTVSANTTSGFSVVTYTGNLTGSGTSTVGHGLGVAPSMIIVKSRSNTTDWCVMHRSLTSWAFQLTLNSTGGQIDSTGSGAGPRPSPTSSVFSINWVTGLGINGQTHVAYCFAEVPGYSRFGSYTGNASTDGPFVFCGFRPAYILIKRSSASGTDWNIYDTTRIPNNVSDDMLFANLSAAELANEPSLAIDILSNGFKVRTTGSSINGTGETMIFAAFASAPQKFSLAR